MAENDLKFPATISLLGTLVTYTMCAVANHEHDEATRFWVEVAQNVTWPVTRKIQTKCDKKANDKAWLGHSWYAQ